jgi:small-conductance mechanosensitive channel
MIEPLKDWLAHIPTLAGALELATVVICMLLAWYSHHRWQKFIDIRLGKSESKGFLRAAQRSTIRVIFPLSMLIYTLIARGALNQFELSTPLLNVVTPLLLSLAAIRILVFILRRAFSPSAALRAWEGIISSVIWIVFALYLIDWLPDVIKMLESIAFTTGDFRFSLMSLIHLILTISIFFITASWLSNIIERSAKRSTHLSASMQVGLTKFSKLLLYTLAILVALSSVGIDLTSLKVFSGALGVGIGFGLQRIASNFISGFILLFDRSIRPGDVITIGDRFGWVEALHARYVVIRDRDGVETLIPNENLVTSEVTNWSFSDRHVRVRIPIQISYADDPEQAMKILLDAHQVNDRVLIDPEPQARLTNFGDNGIDLELRIWLKDPENGVSNVKSDIYLEIWRQFKEHNITIPFPQRDVRLIKESAEH